MQTQVSHVEPWVWQTPGQGAGTGQCAAGMNHTGFPVMYIPGSIRLLYPGFWFPLDSTYCIWTLNLCSS